LFIKCRATLWLTPSLPHVLIVDTVVFTSLEYHVLFEWPFKIRIFHDHRIKQGKNAITITSEAPPGLLNSSRELFSRLNLFLSSPAVVVFVVVVVVVVVVVIGVVEASEVDSRPERHK